MAKGDQINSVIGEGSSFEGSFYISGSLKVDGKFEGEINTEDTLVIGETGKIKTNIKAKEVILAGTLIGDINAREAVRMGNTCKMLGNIETPYLQLSEGVIYKGNVNIMGGQKQDPKKIVEEAFGLKNERDKRS